MQSRTLSVHIERPQSQVYDFLAEPAHFAQWASGLGTDLQRAGDDWIAQTGAGPVRVRFTPRNPHGVLDHRVLLPDGNAVEVPMRAIVNGQGCEVLLTLLRQPAMSDAQFAADADWVLRDLQALRALLEAGDPARA